MTSLFDMAYNLIQAISQSHDFSSPQNATTFRTTIHAWYITYTWEYTYSQYQLVSTSFLEKSPLCSDPKELKQETILYSQ